MTYEFVRDSLCHDGFWLGLTQWFKIEELDQLVKENEKIQRKYEWDIQDMWDTIKSTNIWIMGIQKRKYVHTKDIDNLFNTIIAENFPSLEKERVIQI
jgi:hypothetical protein